MTIIVALACFGGGSVSAYASDGWHLREPSHQETQTTTPRALDGDGRVVVSGELKQWHCVALTMSGPFAAETDREANPFTDFSMWVKFQHADGTVYLVPGYFAADGNAAETSAESGTAWRAHFAPDRVGDWKYSISFRRGKHAAVESDAKSVSVAPFDGLHGTFAIAATDKQKPDLRARGRLEYVGKPYLRFAGTGEYFLKVGADARSSFFTITKSRFGR